jgi:N-acetylglucosamine-6-sulfatase
MQNLGYQAIRTHRHKYIHYTDIQNSDELYDLHSDPYELKNLIHDPAAQNTLAQLQTDLRRLVNESQ